MEFIIIPQLLEGNGNGDIKQQQRMPACSTVVCSAYNSNYCDDPILFCN
jgi:hypothetical protein